MELHYFTKVNEINKTGRKVNFILLQPLRQKIEPILDNKKRNK